MRVTMSERVDGVAPETVARWWSDFEAGSSDHGFLAVPTRRRILERHDERVEMEDEMRVLGLPLFRERTTAWTGPLEVRFEGRNQYASFHGRYAFEAAGPASPSAAADTRVVLDAEVRLAPWLRWSEPLARPIVRAILRHDLRGHARDVATSEVARNGRER